ncbi:right-handed parallel beta-helix repeat-containing protein [Piscinibacter sp. XHJ-5]|uniref:right-handed parallel beta-helix repeat-containing protein n=1 Tax=Piscinibacter sp. XHJ-5 TaxID=3037797 RepID=UPI002452D52F|nr:right-handed parallel beta-helix repeat-containing protein [Piscinibacter sp. XHJ-5]
MRAHRRQPVRTAASPARLRNLVALIMLALAAGIAMIAGVAAAIDVPPRTLGPYLQHRVSDHHPLVAGAGERIARLLELLDRGDARAEGLPRLRVGAQPEAAPGSPGGTAISVSSADDAMLAMERLRAGDVLTFAPGVYRFHATLAARQPGRADAPIVVRAARPSTVTLEFETAEGFVVAAPHWVFENLTLRGVCPQHGDCEHAFHVVGAGAHFIARNNTLNDFNAHIKVNGEGGRFPDDGLVEGNTLANGSVRRTDNPVTPIDLVAASRWTIRRNLIADFVKAGGDRISYGAFAKGGGTENRFEGNVVLCEALLRGTPGWRVGLSLGGGGTGRDHCRDGRCITEQDGGVVESNLVASCSDDGIYVNRAAMSRVMHNTLLDTGGISVRFAQSSADVAGNLVDGAIRTRDGGLLHAEDNLDTGIVALYFGHHPQRGLYRNAAALDLGWRDGAPRRRGPAGASPDLCGSTRASPPAYGAFEDFAACMPK